MGYLMDDRLAHLFQDVRTSALEALVRSLEDRDGIGVVAETVAAISVGQGNAVVES